MVVEQKSQFLEHGGSEEVGFIEEDNRGAPLLEVDVLQGTADLRDHFRLEAGRQATQGSGYVPVDAGYSHSGVGQVDDQVAIWVEAFSKGAQGGGLAAAYLAGDQANASFSQQVGEASF